jgi:hypothetical protein
VLHDGSGDRAALVASSTKNSKDFAHDELVAVLQVVLSSIGLVDGASIGIGILIAYYTNAPLDRLLVLYKTDVMPFLLNLELREHH